MYARMHMHHLHLTDEHAIERCSGTNAYACAQGMHLPRFYRSSSVPAGASRCTPSVPPSMLQIARSRSTHTAPDQLTPHLNMQPSTSTLHFKPLCSGAIHRRAHPRSVVARCARGCGYVSTIICSRQPTYLAFVGCTTRFLADLFASVRDLTCHHAPHAFL